MRKLAVLTFLLLAAPASAGGGPATARLLGCVSATEQSARSATFEGDMALIPRAARMQMRFTLQVRSADAPDWTRVSAPNFDEWSMAAAGKRRYVYDKTVQNLIAPAEYRAVVRYRWRDAGGAVITSTRRVSRGCRQRDPRPDLKATTVRVSEGSQPETRTYEVDIRNVGHAAAGSFAVSLRVNGSQQPDAVGPGLGAGERGVTAIDAPACKAGSTITATLDAADAVDEADERNNSVTIPCPATR